MTGAPRPEPADGGVETRFVAGRGSDVLAVVFSQVRVPAGHFGLSRLFARTRHACLFVNQPSGDWYRGAGHAVDEAIRRAIDATGAARVVLYGSSMGGWGALAAAARWPRADAIAFAPDFRIGEAASRSAEAGLRPIDGEPTVADLLAARTGGRTEVVIGLFDPYDAGVFARLAEAAIRGIDLVPVRSVHAVHDHLYTVNVVRRIIGTFDRPAAEAVAARDLLHPPVDRAALLRLSALARDLAGGRAVEPGAVAALGLAGNPGAGLVEADAFARAGDPAAAEARLARLEDEIAASPTLATLPKRWRKGVYVRRIALLSGLGRTEAAARLAAEASRLFPADRRFAEDAKPDGFGQQD
jgi:hypothetical protein